MAFRGAVVALHCLVAAGLVIANAIVRSEREEMPRLSAVVWPGHPLTLRSAAMAGVGEAAATGKRPSAATGERLRGLAKRAPLAPEPFLVEAALAAKDGQADRSRRLLLEARQRDPRSAAARFLLASDAVSRGDVRMSLEELAVLSRLVPGATMQLVPALADFAKGKGAIARLKQVLRDNPHLEQPLLVALAADPANAELILALATRARTPSGAPAPWQATLLNRMIVEGDYVAAHAMWARLAGLPASRALFQPDFSPNSALPPFGWTLAQSGGGLAEPLPGGGLQVFHFGRETVPLAHQLMVLPAGRYRLAMAIGGNPGTDGQLRWQVHCLPGNAMILDLPLAASGGAAGGEFTVGAGSCAAQRISLVGRVQDTAKTADVQIRRLQLARAAQ